MARTIDLSRVKDRDALVAQREPHWQRLRAGVFLGYRPSKQGAVGTWIARIYHEDTGKYKLKALGDFGALAGNERFTAAKREAEALAALIESGGEVRAKIETVGDACKEYAKTRPEAAQRFTRHVYTDPIAAVKLDKLRRHHVNAWRERLAAKPGIVTHRKNGIVIERERSAATVNRDIAALRAALYKVKQAGTPNTDTAWQAELDATPNTSNRRTLYLDKPQRRALLASISTDAAPFVRALCLLPLRPGAMAALTAGDFDKRTNELTIRTDKAGKDRRIQLPAEAATLMTDQSANKLPGAPLFMRTNGKAWNKDSWKPPIRAAAMAASLPIDTTAYTLRHSTITDLVTARLPLLTIAQISGTSAEMIERHYGHLARDAAVEALGALAL
jgi:integrase